MRTVTALEVRKHFGRILDEAAAGERIVIERAGHPRAALVPLADLEQLDPARRLARRRDALVEIARLARLNPVPHDFDAGAAIRSMRRGREEEITKAIGGTRAG
jgi:prevent-host-death family protein